MFKCLGFSVRAKNHLKLENQVKGRMAYLKMTKPCSNG